MRPLDLLRIPLQGVGLIEASAGTGKTYTLCSLLVRLLVEKRARLSDVLVVTFTNAATAELRERIRSALQEAVGAFEGRAGPGSGSDLDDLVRSRRDPEADARWLRYGLGTLDEASVYTIHGLCERVLGEYAFESGVPFDVELVTDADALLLEVVEDVWSAEIHGASAVQVAFLDRHGLGFRQLLAASRWVVSANPPALVGGSGPECDLEARLGRYLEARARARAEWAGGHEEVTELLRYTPSLNRALCPKGKLEQWVMELRGALDDPNDDAEAWTSGCARLSSSELAQRTKRTHTPPRHPCLDRIEAMREAYCELERGLEAWWLYLLERSLGQVRLRFRRRKQDLGVQTYDDLLERVVESLRDERGEALAAVLRARWPIALIDEFQDTDPVQYEIFRRIYRGSAGPVFLIGDPKQAIYSFRGADVFAYLDAARSSAAHCWTLGTNYRSDPGLIRAVNALFQSRPCPFALDGIDFVPVAPRPGASERLFSPSGSAPLTLLFLTSEGRSGTQGRITRGGWVRSELPKLVAREVAEAFASGTTLEGHRLGPGDVAVLTRTNEQAYDIQNALRRHGIPSVLYGDRSVLDSDEAVEMARVLRALADPSGAGAVRAALVTHLFGVDAEALAALQEDGAAWDEWVGRFVGWHRSASTDGISRAFRELCEETGALSRVLGLPGGERRTTNWLHLVELLQTVSEDQRLGIRALSRWFDRARSDLAFRDYLGQDAHQLRLENDEEAVRITTIHRSKGLEFPWVICPYLWDSGPDTRRLDQPLAYHDPADDYRLKLDLRNRSGPALALELVRREALAESLRLLYVAVTRAKHRVTVVWGRFTGWESAALAYLLHPDTLQQAAEARDPEMLEDLRQFERTSEGSARVVEVRGEPGELGVAPSRPQADLCARRFARRLEPAWSISSFTALASSDSAPGRVASGEREDDEAPEQPEPITEPARTVRWPEPAGFGELPPGAETGVLLHSLLEHMDFRPGHREALPSLVAHELERHGLDAKIDASALAASLEGVVDAPLMPGSTLTLSALGPRQRLSEMEFALAVAASPEGPSFDPNVPFTPRALGEVFRRHPSPAVPPNYPSRLEALRFGSLRGYLRGYVDLVFEFDGRFYVADYKSNRLGPGVEDYNPEALAAAMAGHHYLLQYHLYVVALHRWLGRRVPGYDYERHFGGVLYLFLRGLDPDHSPEHGVFFDRPPGLRVRALSALLGTPVFGAESTISLGSDG